jgi:predicted lipid-binding transport protein (Tim44 family)
MIRFLYTGVLSAAALADLRFGIFGFFIRLLQSDAMAFVHHVKAAFLASFVHAVNRSYGYCDDGQCDAGNQNS